MTFLVLDFLCNNHGEFVVQKVISPIEFILNNNQVYKIKSIQTFDPDYTQNNRILSQKLGINEDEAFILGNLGRYWAKNLMEGRSVKVEENNLIYYSV